MEEAASVVVGFVEVGTAAEMMVVSLVVVREEVAALALVTGVEGGKAATEAGEEVVARAASFAASEEGTTAVAEAEA